jgi:hypothetical protein
LSQIKSFHFFRGATRLSRHGKARGGPPIRLLAARAAVGKPLLHPDDDCIVAVATDAPLPQAQVPVVMLDDVETIANVLQAEALPREQIGKTDAERSTSAPQRSDA